MFLERVSPAFLTTQEFLFLENLPRLCVRSKLTLDWGMLRLAWNGYSAGIARIREVETLLVLLLSNDDSPPGEAEPGDGDAPCPPSSAQESQRFPWLPDCEKRNKKLRSSSGDRSSVRVMSLESEHCATNDGAVKRWTRDLRDNTYYRN